MVGRIAADPEPDGPGLVGERVPRRSRDGVPAAAALMACAEGGLVPAPGQRSRRGGGTVRDGILAP